MTEAFEGALTQIAAVVAGVTGITQAPAQPSETMNTFPFAAIYLANGTLGAGPIGTRKSLYNIAVDVLTNRMDLPRDLQILNPFVDTVKNALLAEVSGNGNRFSETISNFESITIQFIPQIDYAGVQMIGYRFLMNNVKILNNV